MNENARSITETVTRIQKELKCGICCSTFKDPIISTCFHVFCRECIESCFAKKRKLQCPICRQVLDKRSCKDSYQHTQAVQNYLKLSDGFKDEIKKVRSFTALPPEFAFFESQAPLDVTIIPENDGKRVAPDFLMPYLPTRRKRVSKPSTSTPTASPSIPEEPPVFQVPELIPSKKASLEIENVATTSRAEVKKIVEKTHTGCHAKPITINFKDLISVDIDTLIEAFKDSSQKNSDLDDIEALFNILPSSKRFLEKNIRLLMEKFGIVERSLEEKKEKDLEDQENEPKLKRRPKSSERRVTFGKIQEVVESIQRGDEEEEEPVPIKVEPAPFESEKPTISDEVVADSEGDDEIVADSEGEVEKEVVEVKSEGTPRKPRLSEIDATLPCIQNESTILAADLDITPIVIACSRMSNDKDEELCSDFYSQFLSNSCRFTDDVTSKTTHLVMMNSVGRSIPQKSLAYVFAVARKCIVVNRDWLIDCVKHKVLLAETDYTIQYCPPFLASFVESDQSGNLDTNALIPTSWQTAREWNGPKLFQGYFFVIIRKYTWTNVLDYRKVIELVNICGGEIYDDYQSTRPPKLFFICAAQTPSRVDAVKMEREFKCPVVTCEWILDCISEFRILPHENYLTKNVEVDWKMYE